MLRQLRKGILLPPPTLGVKPGWLRFLLFAAVIVSSAGTLASRLSPVVHRPYPASFNEEFDPRLRSVTSVDQAIAILPLFMPGVERPTDRQKVDAVDSFLRLRFFHSYSEYTFRQNWLAYLAGFVWGDLRQPVLPDDILNYRRAACSQQALVFQAMLARMAIDYASVSWVRPGHFTPAARVDGEWRYYDTNLEIGMKSVPVATVLKGDVLSRMYDGARAQTFKKAVRDKRVSFGFVNEYRAPQAALFHRTTAWLSAYGWLAATLLLMLSFVRPSALFRLRTAPPYASMTRAESIGLALPA